MIEAIDKMMDFAERVSVLPSVFAHDCKYKSVRIVLRLIELIWFPITFIISTITILPIVLILLIIEGVFYD